MVSVLCCKLPGCPTAKQGATLFRKKLNFRGTYYIAEVLCLTPKQQLLFPWLSSTVRAQISDVNARKVLLCLQVPLHLSYSCSQDLGHHREEVGLIEAVFINQQHKRGAGT